MKYQPVKSSNLAAIGYQNGTMGIRFLNGSEYHYPEVSAEQCAAIRNAESVGAAFNQFKRSHPYAGVKQ